MKNKKLILCLLIVQLLCFSLILSVSATANNNLSFTLEADASKVNESGYSVYNVGDELLVDISITENPGILAAIMEITYDPAQLTFAGGQLDNSAFTANNGNVLVTNPISGTVKVTIGDTLAALMLPDPLQYTQTGIVATLKFTVASDLSDCLVNIDLFTDKGYVVDLNQKTGADTSIVPDLSAADGFAVQVINPATHTHDWEDATCSTSKTCKLCNGTEGSPLPHDWEDATCTLPKTCKACFATEGSALGHDWENATCTLPKTCKACSVTEGEAGGHSWQKATCQRPKTCSVCQATEGAVSSHTWLGASCTSPNRCAVCGATEGSALGHSFAPATCTAPKTCTVCGSTEGSASGHDWLAGSCTVPKTCKVCGVSDGTTPDHDFTPATCTVPKTCKVCSATDGEPLGHTWSDADCTAPKTCSVCATTEGEALGHNWKDADCTTPKTCITCYETEGEALGHDWQPATCTTPKTCKVCSVTEGEANGHDEVIDEAAAATYFKEGISEGKHCAVCNEILVAQEPIAKKSPVIIFAVSGILVAGIAVTVIIIKKKK